MDASRFGRNSILGAAAGLFTTGSNFIAGVVVARTLGVQGAGEIAYSIWLIAFLVPFFDLGAASTVSRFAPALIGTGENDEVRQLSTALFRVMLCAMLAAAAGIVAIGTISDRSYGSWNDLISHSGSLGPDLLSPTLKWTIVGAWLVLQGLTSFSSAFLRGTFRFGTAALIALGSSALQLAAVTMGALVLGTNGALLGYALGQLPGLAVCIQFAVGPGRLPTQYRVRILRYAGYAWAGNIAAAFVWSRIEIFFLGQFWNSNVVALFACALSLSNLAVQAPTLLSAGLLPLFSSQMARNDTLQVQKAFSATTRAMALLVFPSCFGAAAVLPELLPLLYGTAFEPAAPEAVILLIAAAFTGPSVVTINLVYAAERSDFVFFSGVIGAVLSVLSGLVLVPTFGPFGAALSRAIVQITLVVFGCWFVVSRLGFQLPLKDLARIFLAAALSGAAAYGIVSILPNWKGLLLAIPEGALVYLLAIAAIRPLPPEDLEKLRAVAWNCVKPILSRSPRARHGDGLA